jgi:hypothetical protein
MTLVEAVTLACAVASPVMTIALLIYQSGRRDGRAPGRGEVDKLRADVDQLQTSSVRMGTTLDLHLEECAKAHERSVEAIEQLGQRVDSGFANLQSQIVNVAQGRHGKFQTVIESDGRGR